MDPLIVSIRFNPVGKAYHFDASKIPEIRSGDFVIVETSRGWQLGQIVEIVKNPVLPPDGTWKQVDRQATARDLVLRQSWQAKETDVLSRSQKRASEMRLQGIKVVSAEYSFDGARLTLQFSTEVEEKVELKGLRNELQKMFSPSQVELRQIGPRDVAKLMCGMGACGQAQRCCSMFLTEFSSISIKMAKEQGISLTPTEITGMCGRLRCCLIYEYDHYVELRGKLPRKNKRVITPLGEGKVIDIIPLRQRVVVEIPETGYREFPVEELKYPKKINLLKLGSAEPKQQEHPQQRPQYKQQRKQ